MRRGTGARMMELYAGYAPSAARLAYLLTGDRELAQELTQQAFVKLAGRFTDMREPLAFEAYLRAGVIDLARKHHRRLSVERALARRGGAGGGPRSQDKTTDRVWHALRSLPLRQRAVLLLRCYEGLSEQQTAAVLGCSVSTVRSLVVRATARSGQPSPTAPGELETQLRGLLEPRAEEMDARLEMPASLLRKIRLRRFGWAGTSAALVLGLALAAVALGRAPMPTLNANDGDRVSRAEFIDRADAICAPINDHIPAEVIGPGDGPHDSLLAPSNLREAAGSLHDVSLLVDSELGQLSRLETPPGAARRWNRILSSSREAMSYVGQAQRAAAHGHYGSFASAMRASFGPLERSTRLATAYGFEHCVIR